MKQLSARLPVLCRGDSSAISSWLDEQSLRWIVFCGLAIAVGSGLYGATIGLWRAELMAVYVAIKFPLLIFLTTLCNALLNWMLALMIGAGITFRQTLLAQLMGFTVAALILAAMAPITKAKNAIPLDVISALPDRFPAVRRGSALSRLLGAHFDLDQFRNGIVGKS